MRLQNPFAVVSTTGLDSQVLTVLSRSVAFLPVQRIHALLPEVGSPQGVRKSVARLVEQGTLVERSIGRSVAYALNREHLLIDAILQIARAKGELVARMSAAIELWPTRPIMVTMFGSAARNEMRSDSDIDLLIVMPDEAEPADDVVGEFAVQVSRWTGNDVRPLVYRASEVRGAAIFTEVLADGVDVVGDGSWLRRQLRASA